jgi:membrane protein implicated in regulation of membrane protease activity
MAKKWRHSETSVESTDEDMEAIGEVVDVVTTINSTGDQGRIWFRGTSWPALTKEGTILPGKKARILYRDNLIWRVEAAPESEDKNQVQQKPLILEGEKE